MADSKKLEKIFSGDGGNLVYIIAEIGINHNGSLPQALRLIEASKNAGVDAVKFQKRILKNIYSEKILNDSNSAEWNFDYLIPLLQKFELSKEDYLIIKEKCDELGLDLIVTPFDEESADFVRTLGVPAFKISSADMTNFNLITKCASYGIPLIISTGMWDQEDIATCVDFYKKNNIKCALLLANSSYPTPFESINLKFIDTLKQLCPIVGYSGHERGGFIPVAAVALGCQIIEKHITFDKNSEGPDHKASLLPEEFTDMVRDIRNLEKALGSGTKKLNQAEKLNKEVFAKSAVANFTLKQGHILGKEDISFKSPGKGIFAHQIEKYYGLTLKKDVPAGHYIAAGDFEEEKLIKDWKKFNFNKKWGVKCRFHDFDEYRILNCPVFEFHCSETDLNFNFKGSSPEAQLIIHAPEIVGNELVDICSDDKNKVSKSIDILQRTIDKTIEISKNWPAAKPKLVTHLGGMLMEKTKEKNINKKMIENAIINFGKLKFSAEDIDILPENLPPFPWYLGGEWYQYGFMLPDDFLQFCGHFELGMTLDICHAALYSYDSNTKLDDYVNKVKKMTRHIHISDAKGLNGEGLQIGEGEIDFENVFQELRGIEYSWVPEIWSGHLHNGAGVYKALSVLEKYNEYL